MTMHLSRASYGTMIKSELVERLSRAYPHLYHRDIERIVSRIFAEISGALARGDRVELRGFGAFSVKHRDARLGRNPRTGEPVQVDAKVVPFFKCGKDLRERLNDEDDPMLDPSVPAMGGQSVRRFERHGV